MYIGRGGAPEGVLAACGCLGWRPCRPASGSGKMKTRWNGAARWELKIPKEADPSNDDLVKGDDAMFTATAISNYGGDVN